MSGLFDSTVPNEATGVPRYRMVSAPAEGLEPQVGWVYEMRSQNAEPGWVKLGLVELEDGFVPTVKLTITLRITDLGQHFEELPS